MGLNLHGFLLVICTALLAILAEWSSLQALSGLWLLPAALLVSGLLYEHWSLSRQRLAVTVLLPHVPRLGCVTSINLQFSSGSARPVEIQFIPEGPATLAVDPSLRTLVLQPDGVTSYPLEGLPRRPGVHDWPALRVRVTGVLGLMAWPRTLDPEFSFKVVPDSLRPAGSGRGDAGTGSAPRPHAGSGSEILQLREYRPGDPLRKVDWKASARANQWISRDMAEDQHLEILMVIDAGRTSALKAGNMDRLGVSINVAAKFAEHSVARGDRIGLVVFADRPLVVLPPSSGLAAVLRIRNQLAVLTPGRAESNPLAAATLVRSLVRRRTLVIFMTDLDDATIASQLASAARLLLPRHLPLITGFSSRAVQQLEGRKAGSRSDVMTSLAAREYNARVARNVAVLKAMGAPALTEFPEKMEAAIFSAYDEFRTRRRI